jgi:hypothetical protein
MELGKTGNGHRALVREASDKRHSLHRIEQPQRTRMLADPLG